jgi:hypothetical protein
VASRAAIAYRLLGQADHDAEQYAGMARGAAVNLDGTVRVVKVFVSSPVDVAPERGRVQAVVGKLNRDYEGLVRFDTVLWEDHFYKADRSFQPQIPEAVACDILISIFWTRVGTELPSDFALMPNGRPYPSGTAYELLTALEASKAKGLPDVYVFRKTADATLPTADMERRRQAQTQLDALEAFWTEWFKSEQGHFKAAFQTFASTDEFERQTELLLRQWLESRGLLGPRLRWPKEKGSPFRGLAPFEAEHAAVFFGRDRMIDEARRRLVLAAENATPFLLIVGASGSGKSSLARAGLIPRLTTPGVVPAVEVWRVALMKPSEGQAGPVASLAAGLFAALPELAQGDFPTADALADNLRRGGAAAARPIVGALGRIAEAAQRERQAEQPLRSGVVLLVDQLEELFAQAVGDAERAAFADSLKQLVATGRVWCIATLRADLYQQLLEQPVLKVMKEAGAGLDLGPPGAAELAEIVRAPAAAAGLVFERDTGHGALDERLLADAKTADSLPLLQFTLRQLYERRIEVDGETRLTHAAYDALGGLQGAIAAEAERAVAGLPAGTLDALPRLLRQLAEPTRDGKTLTLRDVAYPDVAVEPTEAALVDALLAARILIARQDGLGRPTLRLAHDAVLSSWPQAREAAQASREFYRIRADVEDALRRWQEHGKPKDRLIQRGVPLAEAERLAADFAPELSAELLAYVTASRSQTRRRQRLVGLAAVFFLVLAIGATGAGLWAYAERTQAETQSKLATERLTAAQVAQSRSLTRVVENLIGSDNFPGAIAVALEGLPVSMADPDRPYIAEAENALRIAFRAAQSSKFETLWQTQLPAAADLASLSADGATVATAAGGSITLYDRATNSHDELPDFGERIWMLHFLPNGWLVAATKTRLRAYDVAAKKFALEFQAPDGQAVCGWHFNARAQAQPLEAFFAAGGAEPDHLEIDTKQPVADQEVALTNADCLPAERPNSPLFKALEQQTRQTMGAPIAADSSIVTPTVSVSALISKSSELWIWAPGRPMRRLMDRDHGSFVAAIPTPSLDIVAGTSLGRVIVVDSRTLTRLYELPAPAPGLSIISLDLSDDGQQIMVGYDHAIIVVRRQTDTELTQLGNRPPPTGGNISTCVQDEPARTVTTADGRRTVQLESGAATLFPTAHDSVSYPLAEPNALIRDAAFSPDGNGVFVVAEPKDNPAQKILVAFDTATGKRLDRRQFDFGDANQCVRASPDGRHALMVDRSDVRLVDFLSGTVIDDAANIRLLGAAFQLSGDRFALYGPDGRLLLMDAATSMPLDGGLWPTLAWKDPVPFGFDASGKTLLIERPGQTFAWSVFPNTESLIEAARASAPACVAPADREKFYLPAEPPDWCIEMRKTPYDTDNWRQWLAARKAGAHPPMPIAAASGLTPPD